VVLCEQLVNARGGMVEGNAKHGGSRQRSKCHEYAYRFRFTAVRHVEGLTMINSQDSILNL
jgi:hypothetical protein